MPSQPLRPSAWDFGSVIDFIHQDEADIRHSPPLRARTHTSQIRETGAVDDCDNERPALHLGSFSKLWEKLGIAIDVPAPVVSLKGAQGDKSSSVDGLLSNSANTSKATSIAIKSSSSQPTGLAITKVTTVDSVSSTRTTDIRQHSIKLDEKPLPDLKSVDDVDTSLMLKERLVRLVDETSASLAKQEQLHEKNQFAGMSKKQRKRARQRARAKQLGQQESSENSDEPAIVSQDLQVQLLENLRADTLSKPTAARSRSNVGAKISPPTPTQAATSVPITIRPITTSTQPTASQPRPLPTRHSTWSTLGLPNQNTSADVFHDRSVLLTPTPLPQQNTIIPAYHVIPGQNPILDVPAQRIQQSRSPHLNRSWSNAAAVNHLDTSLKAQYATANTPYNTGLQTANFSSSFNKDQYLVTPVSNAASLNLIPSSVQPGLRSGKGSPSNVVVLTSKEDRHFEFLKKLMHEFPEDKKWLVSPMRLSSDRVLLDGIHVFVDASNILIGFQDMLRKNDITRSEMSFDCLALLLERRRPVTKRVYAGSTRVSAPQLSNEKFTELAEAVGYEPNIYEQVYKTKELTSSQKFFKDVDRLGWAKAQEIAAAGSSSSDSETGAADPSTPKLAPKWVEQGVDESLHLKMCQSIIDCEAPSTMVLATGDGAGAEYSDGFLAHVERALKKGWCVELVSWRQQISGGYKNKRFRAKWGQNFRIIELDDFLMDMMDA